MGYNFWENGSELKPGEKMENEFIKKISLVQELSTK
jgi:hypothetical protein